MTRLFMAEAVAAINGNVLISRYKDSIFIHAPVAEAL